VVSRKSGLNKTVNEKNNKTQTIKIKEKEMVATIIDEEHSEAYKQVLKLLATKVKKTPSENPQKPKPLPFSFFKKGQEYTLAISARLAKEVGIGIKTIIIRAESPWMAYSSLALLIIKTSAGAGSI
jgi:predicted transcriptional regulator